VTATTTAAAAAADDDDDDDDDDDVTSAPTLIVFQNLLKNLPLCRIISFLTVCSY